MSDPTQSVVGVADEFWSHDEIEAATCCVACGAEQLEPLYRGMMDRLGGVPGVWCMLRCLQCDSLNLSPRPTLAAIIKAYPDKYVTHDSGRAAVDHDNGESVAWRLANDYTNRRFGGERRPSSRWGRLLIPVLWPLRMQLDYFFRHLPRRTGRVLDIGCGNGAFLLRAREAGWSVEGVEPDPQAAAAARSSGLEVFQGSYKEYKPTARYDCITMSHVLEHLHEPNEALATLRGWLKPGGALWIAVPNPEGLGHKHYGRNWFSLDPPRHLFLPRRAQLTRMLVQAGFEDIRCVRRGRGARSSILPSREYLALAGGRESRMRGGLLTLIIDLLSSVSARFSEEIVIVARCK